MSKVITLLYITIRQIFCGIRIQTLCTLIQTSKVKRWRFRFIPPHVTITMALANQSVPTKWVLNPNHPQYHQPFSFHSSLFFCVFCVASTSCMIHLQCLISAFCYNCGLYGGRVGEIDSFPRLAVVTGPHHHSRGNESIIYHLYKTFCNNKIIIMLCLS